MSAAGRAGLSLGRRVEIFADTAADMVSAITMNYVEEADRDRATRPRARPCPWPSLSPSKPTAGCRPGQALGEAIEQVDAATSRYPAYYMINCAHPTHFERVLAGTRKLDGAASRGLRANASRMSHAQLNEAPELDIGDPVELGRQYAAPQAGNWHGLTVHRRLLRHRPPARRADRPGLRALVPGSAIKPRGS